MAGMWRYQTSFQQHPAVSLTSSPMRAQACVSPTYTPERPSLQDPFEAQSLPQMLCLLPQPLKQAGSQVSRRAQDRVPLPWVACSFLICLDQDSPWAP